MLIIIAQNSYFCQLFSKNKKILLSLIKSISGIRGEIGGQVSENLTPIDIVHFTAAFCDWCKQNSTKKNIVIGRDARISGKMVSNLVCGCLVAQGFNVIDVGLSTTPTVEIMVTESDAAGGIILTASHNPENWNALKLLNEKGEFISANAGKTLLKIAAEAKYNFVTEAKLGSYTKNKTALQIHIDKILKLPYVKQSLIAKSNFKVVYDGINSTGGLAIPMLLEKLGVKNVIGINDDVSGKFAHTPEPLPKNITELLEVTKNEQADVGFVVDPDVDRLAFVDENGNYFGEEYTLVAIADYIMQKTKTPSVSNLSSSKALKDISEKHGNSHFASAVGEVNVVEKMKAVGAKIGGEGNGGIILPELHYGRDALVGIALFLSFMAESKMKVSEIRSKYITYFMVKEKAQLTAGLNLDKILNEISEKHKHIKQNKIDGVKFKFENSWVHLRKSNTEPIIRIYAEHTSKEACNELAQKFKTELLDLIK